MSARRFAFLSTAALRAGCASSASHVMPASTNGALDGTWEGSFTASTSDDKGGRITFPINLKLTITGKDAHVYVRDTADRSWAELGTPDPFIFDARGTTGVIYANRAGRILTPKGSRWYETYLVAVAAKAPEQLLVHWMRMVTNIDTPVDDPDHAGVSAGDGVLERK
jgi:hypothetical protein